MLDDQLVAGQPDPVTGLRHHQPLVVGVDQQKEPAGALLGTRRGEAHPQQRRDRAVGAAHRQRATGNLQPLAGVVIDDDIGEQLDRQRLGAGAPVGGRGAGLEQLAALVQRRGQVARRLRLVLEPLVAREFGHHFGEAQPDQRQHQQRQQRQRQREAQAERQAPATRAAPLRTDGTLGHGQPRSTKR